MSDFTKEDVQQWKTNPVTKAFRLAIELTLKDFESSLLNYCGNDLVAFGSTQGRLHNCVEILEDMKNANFEDLIELVKQENEVKNA